MFPPGRFRFSEDEGGRGDCERMRGDRRGDWDRRRSDLRGSERPGEVDLERGEGTGGLADDVAGTFRIAEPSANLASSCDDNGVASWSVIAGVKGGGGCDGAGRVGGGGEGGGGGGGGGGGEVGGGGGVGGGGICGSSTARA